MRIAFSLVTAALILSACTQEAERGGFGEPPPPTVDPSPVPVETEATEPTQIVQVTARGGLRFEPEALEIRAGELTEFELANLDSQDHTFVVGELAIVMLAGAGQTVRSTVAIDPGNTGRFAYFCSINGHRAAGMEGELRVAGT